MFNRPEEIFEVGVDDPLGPRAQLLPDLPQGILGRSPFAVSEAGVIEHRLEDRLQPVQQRLLAYLVINGRDAERAKLTRLAGFRDQLSSHRQGLIGVALEFLMESVQLLVEHLLEIPQGLPIDATGPSVALDPKPGILQIPSLVNLVHQRMDLLVPGRVEPVRQSPRAIAYGSFTHGTDPHDRPYSSGIVPRADHLCRPPSPAHSAADRSVTGLSPRLWYYSAVRRLARHRSPLRLPAYRVADPGATRGPDESSWGHVSIFRTVPSANTLIRRVDENAFAPIVRARPCPAFGRPVHHGDGSPRLRPGTSPQAFRIPPRGGHPALRLSLRTEHGGRYLPLAVSVVSDFVPV